MSGPEFILKSTPPRVSRATLERESLRRFWAEAGERTAITLVAPAGFGKTTVLGQWRRLWLERGALVAWLSVDPQDDPARLTMGLLHAMRSASGRPVFDALITRYASGSEHEMDALTELMAEIARLGTETVLMVDDAEKLPTVSVHGPLQYLLHNAPANLHVVTSSRTALPLQTWELAARGNLAVLGVEELRLRLDESIALLGKRLGQRLDVDQCARVHEATAGWPLGLQLVAATIERQSDLAAALDSLSGRGGDIERYFFESLLSRLPQPVADFLVRIAILDHLNAELCEAVTGTPSAAAYLAQLMANTPIVADAGANDWLRLHPLARDFLLSHFEDLLPAEQSQLHGRASLWYAEHKRFHEAADHAQAMGDEAQAQTYATKALWKLTGQGKLLEAREWLERIPPEILATDVDVRLIVAWIRSFGGTDRAALAVAQAVMVDPSMSPLRRFAAVRAVANTAAYADRLGSIPGIIDEWLRLPSVDDPVQALGHANIMALLALHAGQTQRVRQLAGQARAGVDSDLMRLPLAHGQMLVALSHLWDGDAPRAEAALRPALAQAERTAGRRSIIACMFATIVAAALLERDQLGAAKAMLADRLDVIERTCPPDLVLLAFRTLACIALGEGDERRALHLLERLRELAEHRPWPRLRMFALSEQIRIHALRGRAETVAKCVQSLADLEGEFEHPCFKPFHPLYNLTRAIALAYAGLASNDLDECDKQLEAAGAQADELRRRGDALTVKVLRAVVARQRGDDTALRLLAEAVSLAEIHGSNRLLADTHPVSLAMRDELQAAAAGASRAARANGTTAAGGRVNVTRAGLLTTKETQILTLLGRGLSNKLIARALGVSDETVKWHIKNLFLKLAAGTRKHAVERARLLGLIAQ